MEGCAKAGLCASLQTGKRPRSIISLANSAWHSRARAAHERPRSAKASREPGHIRIREGNACLRGRKHHRPEPSEQLQAVLGEGQMVQAAIRCHCSHIRLDARVAEPQSFSGRVRSETGSRSRPARPQLCSPDHSGHRLRGDALHCHHGRDRCRSGCGPAHRAG